MQINSISAIAPIGASSPKTTISTRPRVTAAPSTTPTAAPAAATTTPQTAAPPAPAARRGGGGGAAAAAASAAAAAATAYSTTVGGKSYSGSVQETDGEYEASIPNLPGASASGSSAEAAEE